MKLYLFLTVVLASHAGYAQDWKVFPYKPAGGVISFPMDEGQHRSEPAIVRLKPGRSFSGYDLNERPPSRSDKISPMERRDEV